MYTHELIEAIRFNFNGKSVSNLNYNSFVALKIGFKVAEIQTLFRFHNTYVNTV
jgi:hypothetical protein